MYRKGADFILEHIAVASYVRKQRQRRMRSDCDDRWIQRMPLEPDQEQQLARRWRQLGDRKSVDKLVTSHLRLAAKSRQALQGIRTASCRSNSRSQSWLGNRSFAIRSRPRARFFDLRAMLDEGHDPSLYSALLVVGQDWHYAGPEEASFSASSPNEQARRSAGAAECGSGRGYSIQLGRVSARGHPDGLPIER